MAGEDEKFLRDQVHRLNSVLAEYQRKYPPIGLTSQSDTNGPQPDLAWMSERTLMSPLMTEYDSNLTMMKEQLGKYQNEQRELRLQVDKLVAENNRLSRELKEAVEIQMTSLPSAVTTDPEEGKASLVEEQLLQNLQHQLQMALQEKDSAMEMWQTSVSEVERLERSVQNQQFNPRLQALEHQANQIKEQYIRTVAELNNEIHTLQQELSISRNELKISQNQTTELRKTLEDLRKQMSIQEHEITEVEDGKKQIFVQSAHVQRKAISTETKLKQTEIDLNQYKHDNAALEQRVNDLQKKCAENEEKTYEAAMKLRDNLQAAESAVLEKEQALLREKQSTQEIARLQEALSALLDQAGARTRQEVDSVRQKCNENINSLMEEIHNLELDNTEKQSQIDRAVREKRAAESELEKIYQEGMRQGHKDTSSYDDLNRRACDAERTRDEALVKMDAVQNEMKRMDMTLKQEKNHLMTEAEQLKDRLAMMNNEFELANNDRVKLTEKIDELQRKMVKVQQERDAAQRNYTKEVTCLTKDKNLKEKEYEVRLQTVEDNHRSGMMELRQMLSSQQRMSAKWKEECQTISAKFEAKVQDLREELKQAKQRNMEVTKLLKDSRDKTLEVEQTLSEYTRNIKRMEERVRESETRAATAAMQASRTPRPDHDLIEERRHLQRELERSLRESRISQGSFPDPLTTADLQPGHVHTTPYTNGTATHDPLEQITAR